jgi:3-oxo-Delta1-steroid hydratase/dehydrogenase large subunit
VPDIADTEHCTPSPFTTYGQKGAGEAGYMGAPAAVSGAINDALAAAGGRLVHSLPVKPADIWAALREPASGGHR